MTHSFPTRPSSDLNACLAKVAKKGCADNGLQYREILLLSCYQRPPLDPALLPPSQRLSPARCHPRRAKEKEQFHVGTAPDFLPCPCRPGPFPPRLFPPALRYSAERRVGNEGLRPDKLRWS